MKSKERFKSIKEDFHDGENKYIFGCWVGFSSIPKVSYKGSGERGSVHTGGCNYFLVFLLRREITGI